MRPKSLAPEPKRTYLEPLSVMGLRNVFDRFFDEWAGMTPWPTPEGRNGGYVPRIDVAETDETITVTAELPGLEEKDVEVDLTNDFVTIRGEKREEKTEKERGTYRRERTYGSFRRDVALPCEVNADRAKAEFRAGVLTVEIPKTGETAVHKIPVHAK